MLVKIHGTSGAGKTTAVRELMKLGEVFKLGRVARPDAYRIDIPKEDYIFVLGSYENDCGGMDTISRVEDQIRLIHHYARMGHVVYEGLLLSTYLGVLAEETNRYSGTHIYAFLDTPVEECIRRVKARRESVGNYKEFNEKGTRDKYTTIQRLKRRAEQRGYRTAMIYHDKPLGPQILELLR